MKVIALIVALVALGWAFPATETSDADEGRLGRRRVENVDKVVSSHTKLQRIPHRAPPQIYWTHSLAGSLSDHDGIITADTNSTKVTGLGFAQNNSYVATINIGRETLQLIVDTGSSDTWIVQKNYTCLDIDANGDYVQAPVCPVFPCIHYDRPYTKHVSWLRFTARCLCFRSVVQRHFPIRHCPGRSEIRHSLRGRFSSGRPSWIPGYHDCRDNSEEAGVHPCRHGGLQRGWTHQRDPGTCVSHCRSSFQQHELVSEDTWLTSPPQV